MASNKNDDQWKTLKNSRGHKLHVQNPQDFSKDELKWLKKKHEERISDNIIPKETDAPKDPRTAVLDGINRIVAEALENNPRNNVPPAYFVELLRSDAERAARDRQQKEQAQNVESESDYEASDKACRSPLIKQASDTLVLDRAKRRTASPRQKRPGISTGREPVSLRSGRMVATRSNWRRRVASSSLVEKVRCGNSTRAWWARRSLHGSRQCWKSSQCRVVFEEGSD